MPPLRKKKYIRPICRLRSLFFRLPNTMLADYSRQIHDLTKSSSTQLQSAALNYTRLLTTEFPLLDLSTPNPSYTHPLGDAYSDFSGVEPDQQYMTRSSSQNSSIRYRQAAFGGIATSESTPSPMLGESALPRTSWNQFENSNSNHLSPQTAQRPLNLHYRTHKRLSSGSSIASAGPDSPYTSTSAYPQIVDLDSTHLASPPLESYDGEYSALVQSSKPLFSPSSSGLHESFLAPAFDNYNPSSYNEESLMAVQTAMREALMEERQPDYSSHGLPSSRPSFGGSYDRESRSSADGRSTVPKLDRTMSDIYQDELYNPSLAASASSTQTRPPSNQGITQSAYSTVKGFSDLIQESKNQHLSARSSPATDVKRERSPFRPDSDFASEGFTNSDPIPRLNSAAHMREQQKAEADARAQLDHQPGRNNDLSSPRTISPKEAQLDYVGTEDDAKMPLFPQESLHKRRNRFSTNNPENQQLARNDVDSNTERSFDSLASSRRQSSSNFSTGTATPSASNFTFMPPSIPGNIQMPQPGSIQTPQQYPFISQLRRQSSSLRSTSDQIPEFHPHLTSFESSKSDSGADQSSNSRQQMSDADSSQMRSPSSPGLPRPSNTAADSGTYTCVSPGCALRFDTAAKLHKHRREAHRQSTPQRAAGPSTPTTSTPTTSTSAANASSAINRNNQAGPHKCERINPSTGKPCNTVFSRSYDLTRHEDTIHNARKQKVRCHLCTEEKTFSRNDALTRHMRVVHPDVDFPGKTKRRAG